MSSVPPPGPPYPADDPRGFVPPQPGTGMPNASRGVPPDPDERAGSTSLGDLLSEVSNDISTLMRQEVELAKAELTQSAKRAGKGAGMFGGAAVAGYFALLFVSICVWWAIGYLVGNAWSALIVAALWGIAALILYLNGRREVQHIKGMPQTVDTLKKIPDALKPDGQSK